MTASTTPSTTPSATRPTCDTCGATIRSHVTVLRDRPYRAPACEPARAAELAARRARRKERPTAQPRLRQVG